MTEHQKINKAQKIAALMMRSPFKGERIAAATLLNKFMNEHGLTTSDIGLDTVDYSYVVNNTNNEVADDPDIIEVIYKHPYQNIRGGWEENLVYRVCIAYGVKFRVQGDTIKIIGFRSEVDAVKATIVTLREHIQSRISVHHFANERQTLAYATCFINEIIKGIIYPRNPAKSEKLAGYMFKHYGLLAAESRCDGYVKYDCRTYVVARVDARDYRCRKVV